LLDMQSALSAWLASPVFLQHIGFFSLL